MRIALACTLAAGVMIAGCGGSSAGVPLAAQDSTTLGQDVGAIRAAAAAGDPSGAHAAAAKLRADVQRLLGQGRLSSTDARSILTGLSQVDGRISAEVHAPVQSTTAPSPPAPAPAAKGPTAKPLPAHPKGHGHGPGKGGNDGGD